MAITASDALYAQQAPAKLASLIGKGVTADDVFYMKQNPQAVANKVGISKEIVFNSEAGSAEFANAVNAALAKQPVSSGTQSSGKESQK